MWTVAGGGGAVPAAGGASCAVTGEAEASAAKSAQRRANVGEIGITGVQGKISRANYRPSPNSENQLVYRVHAGFADGLPRRIGRFLRAPTRRCASSPNG